MFDTKSARRMRCKRSQKLLEAMLWDRQVGIVGPWCLEKMRKCPTHISKHWIVLSRAQVRGATDFPALLLCDCCYADLRGRTKKNFSFCHADHFEKNTQIASMFYVKNITRNLMDLRGLKSTSIFWARCAFFGAWNSQKHVFAACDFCGRVVTRAYAERLKTQTFS